MVIAVFAGKAPSGTSIEITRVTHDARTTTVHFHVREAASTAVTEKSPISPFHMVVVPATRTPVTFVNITAS